MPVCPTIDPLRPPTLPRDLPHVFLFAATCLPGTATASGCAPEQMFYSVLIPWDKVVNEGWTAPGGNRYWASSTPENSPAGLAILRLMADESRKHFQRVFSGSDRRMSEVLQTYAGKLALVEGIVRVPIQPDPNETAGTFVRRGGYLLWIDPATGPFRSRQALDRYKAAWMGGDVAGSQLWGHYRPQTKTVEYSLRLVYKGTWQTVATTITRAGGWSVRNFCSTITSEKATQAAYAAALYPGAQPYVAAWGAATQMCGYGTAPAEPCTPREGQPQPPAPPVTGSAGWKTANTAWAGGAANVLTAAVTSQVAYPAGSIAYVDPVPQLIHIAFPQPGKGTTHALQTSLPFTDGAPRVPSTLFQVTREQWERATLPWTKRRSTKIGAFGVALIGAAATAVLVARNQT